MRLFRWCQISAIKVLVGDLRGGLSKVNTEILKAAGVDANSAFAHRQFGDLMMAFHQHAKTTFSVAEVCSPACPFCSSPSRPPPPPCHPTSLFCSEVTAANQEWCVWFAHSVELL